jgi:uncharacterized protein (TIGR02145 family)
MTVFKKILRIKPYRALFLAALLFCVCSDSSTNSHLYNLTTKVYPAGAVVTLTATVDVPRDYYFVHWTGTGISAPDTAESIQITMNSHRTITAHFAPKAGPVGSFTDPRDGQVYRTTTIGRQTWMAENLNYAGSGGTQLGMCYRDEPDSCEIYGRLYDWNTLMDGASSSSSNPSGVQGICPAGWHVPSDAEWDELVSLVGDSAGVRLKSRSGWYTPGTDEFGFSALPGGGRLDNFAYAGSHGFWWSATENSANYAWSYAITTISVDMGAGNNSKRRAFSLRCVKNY